MSITNVARPSTSMTNLSKPSHEVTWDSNTTTFDTETRTWGDMASIISNVGRPSGDYLWGARSLLWTEDSPWDDVYSGMTNIARPL